MRTIGTKVVKDQKCSFFDYENPQSQETIQKIRDNVNIRELNLVICENIREPTEERKKSVSDSELSANEHAEENVSDNASVVAPEMREPPDLSGNRPTRERRVPARLTDYVVFK
ncbi:unnamed protein product [Lasius platythorax]|uniref:Uncharacterized protein n=1 Tax=Lasius platythorax TaxID=488582 RepID=A0AAV2NDP4_9HYME